MATTTNYGWTTPDDTALVKDGASAIRTLGTSVDTTTKNLNPETTLGDIAYRSSTSNVNTRLGIGTSGQFLTVSGGVPAWAAVAAGGMTLLSTTTLSGASTTISSIDQTYNNLFVLVTGMTNNTANGDFRVEINAGTTNCVTTGVFAEAASQNTYRLYNDRAFRYAGNNQVFRSSANNGFMLQINDYASTTAMKTISNIYFCVDSNANNFTQVASGGFFSTSAATSLVFSNSGGTWSAGTVRIYGVK
jgi:hypothetical protein